MRTAFIVHDCDNESLLRFTQTKLLFDANNQGIDVFNDIVTVSDYETAETLYSEGDVILETGDFLTTTFRKKYLTKYAKDSEHVIKFDKKIPIDFKHRHYKPRSKHLYIIENLLKVCIRSTKLVYLDNNESDITHYHKADHLYGLASGWKTVKYALANDFKTIAVYDFNQRQLDFAQWLHSHPKLPKIVDIEQPTSGNYSPSRYLIENWKRWHELPVKFKQIDLYSTPVFPKNSLIWISNVFNYEPTIFKYGYDHAKNSKNKLHQVNNNSIITTN